MTTTVITRTTRLNKVGIKNLATLAVWQSVRGLWGKSKVNPVKYQQSSRRERAIKE